jgi:transketolase
MRKAFFDQFLKEDAWLIYDDVGYQVIPIDHPRCINVGIAEQTMVGMAAGMASEGAKVYCYAIAPHYLRAWEFVRNMVAETKRDVPLVAVGVDDDYEHLGKTHMIASYEMFLLCNAIHLPYYCPCDLNGLASAMSQPGPKMLHLRKGGV